MQINVKRIYWDSKEREMVFVLSNGTRLAREVAVVTVVEALDGRDVVEKAEWVRV